MTHSNNQDNTSPKTGQDHHSQPNNSNGTQAESAVATLLNGDKLSYQQVEGLTDSDQLQQAIEREDIPKNPENALQEQGVEREQAIQLNDGSHGNETIRKAMENLDSDEMRHNLKDEGDDTDQTSPNPAPFIEPK
ncbi:hypothetical protein [Acinetobacter sp. WCHA45]|uniref:hypothetical protein n=1 Tax=Acinetobacter sp. WCHA45 TaxID=2004644 RepID=UPI000B3C565D|nr:hypothetical protein [Acinetobacter sp. WCHA45]AVZ84793.1 hypothetical protein CDG55_02840 [Acinetobacter sp. WCHA45]